MKTGNKYDRNNMNLKKKKSRLCFFLMRLPMSGYMRGKLAQKAGIKIVALPNTPHLFVGEGVILDRVNPGGIEIGSWTTLATGVVILSHFLDSDLPQVGFRFHNGRVKIGQACFIGANTVICRGISIGDNSIIGAGSVVTKNIPPNEIWAGNPARFIRKRK